MGVRPPIHPLPPAASFGVIVFGGGKKSCSASSCTVVARTYCRAMFGTSMRRSRGKVRSALKRERWARAQGISRVIHGLDRRGTIFLSWAVGQGVAGRSCGQRKGVIDSSFTRSGNQHIARGQRTILTIQSSYMLSYLNLVRYVLAQVNEIPIKKCCKHGPMISPRRNLLELNIQGHRWKDSRRREHGSTKLYSISSSLRHWHENESTQIQAPITRN